MNLSDLNPQQLAAVKTVHGPVLVLAGAGTGKTRVITCRIAYMIRQGIPADQILAVTFTNKAAREMKERLARILGRRSAGGRRAPLPWVGTFHSFGVRLLRRHIERLGYKRNFVIYNEGDQVAAIKKILSRFPGRDGATDPQLLLGWLSRWKNGMPPAGVTALFERVADLYASALRAANAVDFDDLLGLTLRLFDEHPDVLAEARAQFRYVLVDEYQDTNRLQFRLLEALAGEHRNLCVVGDDDQSIYGWRGAEVRNLLDLEQHFPGLKTIALEQNYRSTNTILQAANSLIAHNPRRRRKQLWSANGQGARIGLQVFPDETAEARFLAEEIEFRRMMKGVPWSRQAVLFRINAQSRPLETALREARIRYRVVGGQSYFDRREIKDFLAYLKICLNPDDDISLLRIANVPARGLGDATMEQLLRTSLEHSSSVFAAMRHPETARAFPPRAAEGLSGFVALIEAGQASLRSPATGPAASLATWARRFMERSGYLEALSRSKKDPDSAEIRRAQLEDLIGSLDGVPSAGTLEDRLQQFLEALALETDEANEDDDPGEAVTLITIHSCKGLEFPHVYIAGVEDGLLPHSRSKEETGLLDEERRLFYVAMTRARESLTLTSCLGRKKFGQTLPCQPSPFLKELPPDLVEEIDAQPRQPVPPQEAGHLFAQMRQVAGPVDHGLESRL